MEENGVNCIDLYAPNPDLCTNLGSALSGRRDKFVLQAHLCAVWKNGQYKRTREISEVKEGFQDQLARLQTDHVEIGMIKSIGLSSHNPEAALEAVNSGLIDVLMFSVNPCYDLQPGNEDIELLWAQELQ